MPVITPPRCRKIFGVAVTAALALSGNAQTPPAINGVAHVSVELDSGWTLESAIVNNELVGFFAWIPQAEVTSGNVYLAWVEHVGGGAWAMYGWTTGDAANAVYAIEAELNDLGALKGVDTFEIDQSQTTTDECGGIQPGNAGGGVVIANGVTVTDPAAPLMASVAGDPVVAGNIVGILASSGASAAPGISEMLVGTSLCPGVANGDVVFSYLANDIAVQTSVSWRASA